MPMPGKLKVLVVDDHADTLVSMCALLRRWGYEVIEAQRGDEALERNSAELPDVVLLDLGMPDMTGFEVAREIRNRKSIRRPTLIAHTGNAWPLQERQTHEAGFDFLMVKPVPPHDLKKVLGWFS
jgi:two-component system, chemotaxis family, CheB/CheR fusion protein